MTETTMKKMPEEEALEKSLDLVLRSQITFLGTIDEEGYPNVKGMFKAKSQGLEEVWFSTNTSSERVRQILASKRTCVYFVGMEKIMGLMLVGETEARRDEEARRMIWQKGDERYYPEGIDDPDFTVLHFKAHEGNLYRGLRKCKFEIRRKEKEG